MIHLVCGSTGAGKTTYAGRLSRQLGAMHLSIDDWMVTLFSPDMPQPLDWAWIGERVARCERQIAATALQLGRIGVASILDLGLLRSDDRRRIAALAAEAGLAVHLHFLDVDPVERWRRVGTRNAEKGETFRLTVTRAMFDFIETIWQPPDADEMAALNGVRVTLQD
ncbi:MAG: ATP-binding protein [Reyranella sp.]|nr:ATP-binding protein [Reyranella sp.]